MSLDFADMDEDLVSAALWMGEDPVGPCIGLDPTEFPLDAGLDPAVVYDPGFVI